MDGHACNGWAFWTVGDGATATAPVRRSKATRTQPNSVRAVLKPTTKGRSAGSEGRPGQAPEPRLAVAAEGVECGDCGRVFATQEEALTHMETAHGTPQDEPHRVIPVRALFPRAGSSPSLLCSYTTLTTPPPTPHQRERGPHTGGSNGGSRCSGRPSR